MTSITVGEVEFTMTLRGRADRVRRSQSAPASERERPQSIHDLHLEDQSQIGGQGQNQTPSDSQHPTVPSQPAGSPEITFSASLESRLASTDLSRPFGLQTQQSGASEEEQAALRELEARVLTSMRMLNYNAPTPRRFVDDPTVTFFHVHLDPIR